MRSKILCEMSGGFFLLKFRAVCPLALVENSATSIFSFEFVAILEFDLAPNVIGWEADVTVDECLNLYNVSTRKAMHLSISGWRAGV